MSTKESNPKSAVGIRKACMSVVSKPVMMEVGVAMTEGARKYGRHNWRIAGARVSTYLDATQRHLDSFWEGRDIDPDSGVNELTKAIASLMVLRDAQIHGKMMDDRPPKSPKGWLEEINAAASAVIDKYPDPKDAYVEGDQNINMTDPKEGQSK